MDELQVSSSSRHVIVLYRGHIWRLNIFNADGTAVVEGELHKQLEELRQETDQLPLGAGLGVFTASDRDEWADTRAQLLLKNSDALRIVDSSLLAVILLSDDEVAGEDRKSSLTAFAKASLCGDARSRWFDKSLQLIFSPDGSCAVNMEHSWGDGHTLQRFMHQVYYDSIGEPSGYKPLKGSGVGQPSGTMERQALKERLEWILPPIVQTRLPLAGNAEKITWKKCPNIITVPYSPLHSLQLLHCWSLRTLPFTNVVQRIEQFARLTQLELLLYSKWGKRALIHPDFNADGIFQFAFQLSYYRLHYHLGSAYEAASMRHFAYGRTDNIRPLTAEAAEQVRVFAAAMEGRRSNRSSDELWMGLSQVSRAHVQRVKETLQGRGCDRHLFALNRLAQERSSRTPEIFQHSSFTSTFNSHILSTSTLASDAFFFGAFGAVCPQGYAVAYRTGPHDMTIAVSCYEGGGTSAREFARSLKEVFDFIGEVVCPSSLGVKEH